MSRLRVLRNLAVLVILTVGVLASTPRQAAAKQCRGAGAACNNGRLCCQGLVCGAGGSCVTCVGFLAICSPLRPCCPGFVCALPLGGGFKACIR